MDLVGFYHLAEAPFGVHIVCQEEASRAALFVASLLECAAPLPETEIGPKIFGQRGCRAIEREREILSEGDTCNLRVGRDPLWSCFPMPDSPHAESLESQRRREREAEGGRGKGRRREEKDCQEGEAGK